jgi:hypothetical protein
MRGSLEDAFTAASIIIGVFLLFTAKNGKMGPTLALASAWAIGAGFVFMPDATRSTIGAAISGFFSALVNGTLF